MERDDRSPVATFYAAAEIVSGGAVALDESAAHHARVKRLEVGDVVRITNGRGAVGTGAIAALRKTGIDVTIDHAQRATRPPAIHVRVPVGDRDRMLWLAEKATELGVASWQAVRFRRSLSVSPRGEGAAFGDKVAARMISALEQSGGAWLPDRLPDTTIDAIDAPEPGRRILLDGSGAPILGVVANEPAVLLFGPEGGLESEEKEGLTNAGWRAASLAGTTLRFETAGIAAIAVVRAVLAAGETPGGSSDG